MENMIEVKNLTIRYKEKIAVNRISFSVQKGRVFIIAGPNGAGKTSVIEAIEGICPYEGLITINGFAPFNNEVKKIIGVQLENMQFDKNIKVREILEMFSCFYRKKGNIESIITELNIRDKTNEYYAKLSKGWKQRVNIAIALVNDPKLLFFDEISSGLDPESRQDILQLLFKLKKKGKTIILSSHDLQGIQDIADQIMILNEGKLILLEDVNNLLNNFICTDKIDYWDTETIESPYIKFSIKHQNKQTLFTNNPEKLKEQLIKEYNHNQLDIYLNKINLEDIYFYYIRSDKIDKAIYH